MNEHILSAETQATLLLCGVFGGEPSSVQPLTLAEFNKFEQWLAGEHLSLSALIEADSQWLMQKLQNSGFDVERLSALLSRGSAMAIAVEQWTNIGLWILSRTNEEYPERLKCRLRQTAPAILYGAGNRQLLSHGGSAVVGSRDADEVALSFAHTVGEVCAQQGVQVISGGARGVDSRAMSGALERGGTVVGALSGNLAHEIMSGECRSYLADDKLALLSPFHPKAAFNMGRAMERNKLIYAMADFALVVSADLNKGGAWNSALENLKKGWVPLFVRDDASAPDGNCGLIERGGIAIEATAIHSDVPFLEKLRELAELAGATLKPTSRSAESEEQLSLRWDPKESPKPRKKSRKKKTTKDLRRRGRSPDLPGIRRGESGDSPPRSDVGADQCVCPQYERHCGPGDPQRRDYLSRTTTSQHAPACWSDDVVCESIRQWSVTTWTDCGRVAHGVGRKDWTFESA